MPHNVLVLWRDQEALDFVDRVYATGSVGMQMRHRQKGERLYVCSTAGNELYLLGLLQVLQVSDRGKTYRADCRNLSGIFRRIPLGEKKWQLRFVGTQSDRLDRKVAVSSQVQTNRYLSDQSAELLADMLDKKLAAEERDRRFAEGERQLVRSMKATRSVALRRAARAKYGTGCYCCGFDFGEFYGPSASGLCQVHHLLPLSESGAVETNLDEVRVVCANCHLVLHAEKVTADVLRRRLQRRWQGWTERGIRKR